MIIIIIIIIIEIIAIMIMIIIIIITIDQQRSSFTKSVNKLNLLTVSKEKLHRRLRTGFQMRIRLGVM